MEAMRLRKSVDFSRPKTTLASNEGRDCRQANSERNLERFVGDGDSESAGEVGNG